MKRSAGLWLGVAGIGCLLFAARCSQEGPGSTTGNGGTTGAAGTGTGPGTAGTTGTAGTGTGPGTAGTTGTAGTGTPGTAGSTATAGSTGTAGTGTPGTAGSTGSAGRGGTTGTAGSSAAGTTGTAGTTGSAGRGGTTGSAGTTGTAGTTGSAGKGGTTGTAGSTGTAGTGAGGSGTINISDIVNVCSTTTWQTPSDCFDGYYWEATPSGNTSLSGTNYPYGPSAGGCPSGTTWATTGYINNSFPTIHIKGTTGQQYTLHIHVRGVVGTRCYTGGTAAFTGTPNASGANNTWYAGGTQYNDSIWNTMEIHVAPAVTGAPNVYYTNSFPNISNWCQKEATYETGFDASFPVLGGGTINLVIHDSNCRTLANCGAVENQSTCDTTASRSISMTGVSPAPATFTQPRTSALGGTTYYPQWVWIDVTSITSP